MSKGFWIAIAALVIGVVGFLSVGTLYEPDIAVEPVSAAVAEPVAKEPTPDMTPTIHTDPKMALTYAKQRLADLKADYARNAALYQDRDAQGLRNIRGELIDAMNANEYEYPSEMRYFHDCDQAYQAVVYLNAYYLSESMHQDGYRLEEIFNKETEYRDKRDDCEEQVKLSESYL